MTYEEFHRRATVALYAASEIARRTRTFALSGISQRVVEELKILVDVSDSFDVSDTFFLDVFKTQSVVYLKVLEGQDGTGRIS